MDLIRATDVELVARCRQMGDQNAFAELVRRYRDRVFRLALSILGRGFDGEAEEVAQEVFTRIYYALDQFRGEAAFGSWVYRVTFNQAVNLKSRVRYRAPHVNEEALQRRATQGIGPEEQLALKKQKQAVEECIGELPEVYQAALRLHYWMGASMVEIAELIGVPENTVKSYMHRARRLLRVMLKERGIDDV